MAKPTEIEGLGPRTRIADAGPKILAARTADVRTFESKVAKKMGGGAVHDMRVASRRLRAALGLFGDKRLLRLEREVKRLQDALGKVRDAQVQLEWLAGATGKAPAPSFEGLIREQQRILTSAKRDLRRELTRWARLGAPAIARNPQHVGGKGRLGGKGMRRRTLKRFARFERRLEAFRKSLDAATAHALRIELKKLRYELELLSAAFSTGASSTLALLVPLQDKLGALHDSDVRMDLLTGFAARSKNEHQPDVLSLADRVLQTRRDQSAQLVEEVERWRAQKSVRRLTKLFT